MHKGGDGLFGPGDYLLFYAQGPVAWQYSTDEGMFIHRLHDYALKGYYFLTDDHGTPVAPDEQTLSTETPTHTVTAYDYRAQFEEETYNLINSGREWYGDNFNLNLEENYPFALPVRESGEDVRVRITVAARSNEVSSFLVKANGSSLGSIDLNATDLSTYTAIHAYEQSRVFNHQTGQDNLTITLTYDRPNTNSDGWLNSITVNARGTLTLEGDELLFRDSRSAGTGNLGAFRVENCGAGTLIWEISDPSRPLNIPVSYTHLRAHET